MLPAALKLVPALRPEFINDHARKVDDADEEIFLLYSLSAPKEGRRGLGYFEHVRDLLKITIDLSDRSTSREEQSSPAFVVDPVEDKAELQTSPSAQRKTAHKRSGNSARASQDVTTYIWQDQTSLRRHVGSAVTGSVVWRSSVILAATLLRQCGRTLADQDGNGLPPLLDLPSSLQVLELGSGTGILPALLFSSAQFLSKEIHWLATDREDMLQLLNKNLRQLSQRHPATCELVLPELVDWLEVHDAVKKAKTGSTWLRSVLKQVCACFDGAKRDDSLEGADLIIAVDCIFNPSLVPAFLDTLAVLSAPDRTVSFILVELREPEMMAHFLSTWLLHEFHGKMWDIWSLESGALGKEGLERGYACFVGYLRNT